MKLKQTHGAAALNSTVLLMAGIVGDAAVGLVLGGKVGDSVGLRVG